MIGFLNFFEYYGKSFPLMILASLSLPILGFLTMLTINIIGKIIKKDILPLVKIWFMGLFGYIDGYFIPYILGFFSYGVFIAIIVASICTYQEYSKDYKKAEYEYYTNNSTIVEEFQNIKQPTFLKCIQAEEYNASLVSCSYLTSEWINKAKKIDTAKMWSKFYDSVGIGNGELSPWSSFILSKKK